jgi:N-acetylglucosamine-6-phosphate deacetylase
MYTLLENIRIILQNSIIEGYILIEGGIIAAVGEGPAPAESVPPNTERIDCGYLYCSPGFIDLHNHGRLGADAMSGSEALATIAEGQLDHGVTGFLAGTSTIAWDKALSSIRAVAAYCTEGPAANAPGEKAAKPGGKARSRCLGIYSEGNFFSMEKRGAHNPKYLRNPSPQDMDDLVEAGGGQLRIAALSPELPGGLDAISKLKKAGIVVSAAHSDATLTEALAGINRGITQSTHTFIGMRALNHQEPGIVGAVLQDDRVFCELIADGIHIHPLILSLVYRIKGADRIVLISDSVALNGLEDGSYEADGLRAVVKDGIIRLEDGRLAGSSLSLDRAVYNMHTLADVPLWEAVRMASLNPARILGIEEHKGSIEVGKDADLALFDDECKVREVFLEGRRVSL